MQKLKPVNKILYYNNDIKLCQHYKRNCKILAPCCKQYFDCRLCHDAVQSHPIDRYSIKTVQCNSCDTIQDKSSECQNCKQPFAEHFCNICNLWAEFPIVHCNQCKICYKESIQDRFHCDTCNLCYAAGEHTCTNKKADPDSECCVCLERLYYQHLAAANLQCGHWIHSKCLEGMMQNNKYQCPLCKKTMIDVDWSKYKSIICAIPIPTEQEAKDVELLCNDCLKKSQTVFHPIAMECSNCGSFNTAIFKN